MEQLIEFIGNHLALFCALAVILALLTHNLVSAAGKASVDAHRATTLINHDDAVVIDVRPMADYAKGHIINAINVPANGFSQQLNQLQKYKDTPVIVTCHSGVQSGGPYKTLSKDGFSQVYELKGGMHAWQSNNLPVSRKK